VGEFYEAPPSPPLYVVDEPNRVELRLTLGGVDKRHYGRIHPILARSGVTKDVWCDLLHAIDSAPRIPWAEFAGLRRISPQAWVGTCLMAAPWTLAILGVVFRSSSKPPLPVLASTGIPIYLMSFASCAALYCAIAWSRRAFDEEGVSRIISRFSPILRKHGASLIVTDEGSPSLKVEAILRKGGP
jgi:hypothetical protein